jgi:hypothetical protein
MWDLVPWMDAMPKKFTPEFRRHLVRVARQVIRASPEIAPDFDISVEVRRWMSVLFVRT